MLIYLGLSALLAFIAALALSVLGEASPLAIAHLAFAVAAMPLIFGAINHFVPVLTRTAGAPWAIRLAPLLLQLAGLLAFLYFSGRVGTAALHAGAGIALLVALASLGWLLLKARST